MNKRIVILHGWGASVNKLEPLSLELEKNGWQVLLPELPGFDAPDPSKPWSLDDYANHVLKRARTKWSDSKFYVFGHSFGGRIAIKLASRGEMQIIGIILCASGGISRGNPLKRLFFMVISKLGKAMILIPPLASLLRKLIYKVAREHDYEKSNKIMKKTMRKIIGEDLKTQVNDIKVPTLILWGKQDRTTPYQDAIFLNDHIKQSKLVDFVNEGHRLPYNKYKEITEEMHKWM